MLSADWELEWLHKMVFGSYSEKIIATRGLGRYSARPRDEVIESQLAVLTNEPGSQLYRFAVQEIMSNAASWMDRPLFEEMLARAEEFQRRTGVPFGLVHRSDGFIENARFWIPPQHPWFPEVQKRLGEGLECAPVSHVFHFKITEQQQIRQPEAYRNHQFYYRLMQHTAGQDARLAVLLQCLILAMPDVGKTPVRDVNFSGSFMDRLKKLLPENTDLAL